MGIADVIDMYPYVVVYPPRPAAGSDQGLCAICRTDHLDGAADHLFELSEMARRASMVEPWDYHAAARQHRRDAEQANPEAVAYAKANPNNAAAQWAAYGIQY
ncbi:hypothetical protein [Nocardia salmonicida]|uniref:hypothetical protein n=1 Tax=Nocardia salmonicida TaxID=53431 RepID=UPI0007A4D504|nr:hypothetical protein [Nocardia salmonicida]